MAKNLFDGLSPKAAFAEKLFAAAGIDLVALIATGDINALKAHVDGKVQSVDIAAAINLATDALQKDNSALTKTAEVITNLYTPLVAALETASGIKLAAVQDDKGSFSAEKFTAAYNLGVAKAARVVLSKHGIAPLDETVVAEPVKKQGRADKLTLADFNALKSAERFAFIRRGGIIE